MHHFRMQPKLINLIEELYRCTESTVLVGNEKSDWFTQTVGVCQGCILSPDLFNIFLEHIMREALQDDTSIENNIVKVNKRINNLRLGVHLQFV